MTERRKFLRFETALNALCEIASERHEAASRIQNISKEGALVLLPKPLKEGTEINLAMDVPGDNIPIFASGHVAWQNRGAGRRKGRLYETGVRFTKINNGNRGRLFEYIYTQWLKLQDKSGRRR